MINCVKCKEAIEENFSFCPYCGWAQEDKCPSCNEIVSLHKTFCSRCKTLFRYCDDCFRHYTLDIKECENDKCYGKIRDYYIGYHTANVNQERSGAIIDKEIQEFIIPEAGKIPSDLWTWKINNNISDLFSAYGRLFWIDSQGQICYMSEIDGEKDSQVSSDRIAGVKPEDISNITISGEYLCFLANSEHIEEAFCYDVNSLDRIKSIKGKYKSFIVCGDKWILFKNREENLIIECYNFYEDQPLFVKKLNENDLYENLYPVLYNDIIYFITKDKKIYYLEIEEENIIHLPFDIEALYDFKQPCLGYHYLRFFALDSNNNYNLCSYSIKNKNPFIEGLGGRLPFYNIKAMNKLLFIYDISNRGEMQVYNTEISLGSYLGEAETVKGFTTTGEHLEDFLPIEIKKDRVLLFSVRDNRVLKFKIFNFKDKVFRDIAQRPISTEAKFIYSNGKLFIYTKNPGEINCIELSK